MTTAIEQRFAEIGETSSGGRLLRAQWEYDKRLITSALGTIGTHFPHYSQHDASHSETILHRIASILGPMGIDALSVSDLWLLLESAFLHDAGMVVLDAEKRGDLASPDFAMFLRDTLNGTDKEMAGLARRMLEASETVSAVAVHEKHQLLIPLYAEFVRRRHADRAERAVLDPMTTLAAPSPRAWLIPNRLWRAIARISTAHGKDIDYALGLPHRELGLTTDYCHPRFIACLLRLGDLLDLDSGRFCPSVNAQLSRMPATSISHQRKHEGVERFVVSPDRIEVEAEYTDADAYFEAEKWFSWLREELTVQTLHWSDIAPNAATGRLPMAGKIQARLRNQILLGTNSRPRLEVDREKLLAIARGANIYESEHDVVREIVQNAIDATLLRYSYDCQSEGRACAENPDAIRAALAIYPIDVLFEKDLRDPVNHPTRWAFVVRDRGIGMSRDDIARMLSVGSSKKSRARTQLLDWLPEWARPSGAFGIGFNSLFQYCTEVRVDTKHVREHEAYSIDFTKDAIEDDPRVVVTSERWGEAAVPRVPGTTVTGYLAIEPIETAIRGSYESQVRMLRNFDPLLDDELPMAQARAHDVVKGMAQNGLCRLRFALENMERAGNADGSRLFLSEFGVEITLLGCSLGRIDCVSRYRSAPVPDWNFSQILLGVDIDILSGTAPGLLQLSRRDWTHDGYQRLYEIISVVLPRAAAHWLDHATLNDEDRRLVQLYIALRNNALNEPGGWREIEMDEDVRIGDLAAARSLVVFDNSRRSSEFERGARCVGEGCYEVDTACSPPGIVGWLAPLLRQNFRSVECMRRGGNLEYRFARDASWIAEIACNEYSAMVSRAMKRSILFRPSRRVSIPCPDRFANLRSRSQLPFMYWEDALFPYFAISPFRQTNEEDVSPRWSADHLDAYITRVATDNNKTPAQVCAHLSDLFDELGSSEDWCKFSGLSTDEMQRELCTAKKKLSLD